MANLKDIVEKLSQFNNMSFTKKQWEIILKGCGCPKSCHFWKALRSNNLQRNQWMYTLVDIDSKTIEMVWSLYCQANRASVKKAYDNKKVKKQVAKRKREFEGITFFMIDGYLTTSKPTRE